MGNTESAAFPYTITDQIHAFSSSIGWTLHNGKDNATNALVSIFCFDKVKSAAKVECARNGMILLRQLRHPFILKYIAGSEQSNHIYIVTEPVTPFSLPYRPFDQSPSGGLGGNKNYGASNDATSSNYHSNDSSSPTVTQSNIFTSTSLDLHLKPLETSSPQSVELLVSAGLFQLFTALDFLNISASIVHGMINPGSIFITQNGDWKLGGFDLAFKATPSTTSAPIPADSAAFAIQSTSPTSPYSTNNSSTHKHQVVGPIPASYRNFYSSQVKEYLAPDILSNQWKKLENMPIHSIDAFSIAQLLRLLVNPIPSTASTSTTLSTSSTAIPPLLINEYRTYFPSTSPQQLETHPLANLPLHSLTLQSTYFNNHLIAAVMFLDSIHVKTIEEKTAFFTQFSTTYTMFPTLTLRKRIIPQLLQSFDVITPKTAGASFGGILNATFAVSKVCLPPAEYTSLVVPLIQRLFQSPDFEVRLSLLRNIKEFAHLLTPDLVFNDVLPTLMPGLTDQNPTFRELTVNAFSTFFPQFLKAKNGEYDSNYTNLAIISSKLTQDAYAYASTTFSSLATYMGYATNGQPNSLSTHINANNPNSLSSSSSSSNSTHQSTSSGITPSQVQSISSAQIMANPVAQNTARFYALPSQYLSTIIFPNLISLFPTELIPSIRSAIILAATSLSPLLSISQQETLLLTVYAKGMKDHAISVRCTALDGLIISILTSGFTVHTICNKIIPFVAPFVLEKEQEIFSRAIFILQYSLHKVQHQYHTQQLPIEHIIQNIITNYHNLHLDLTEIQKQLSQLPQPTFQPSGVPAQVSTSKSSISTLSTAQSADTGLMMLQQTTQAKKKTKQGESEEDSASLHNAFPELAPQLVSASLPPQSNPLTSPTTLQPSSPQARSRPIVSETGVSGMTNNDDGYWNNFHANVGQNIQGDHDGPRGQTNTQSLQNNPNPSTYRSKLVQKSTTIDFDDVELDPSFNSATRRAQTKSSQNNPPKQHDTTQSMQFDIFDASPPQTGTNFRQQPQVSPQPTAQPSLDQNTTSTTYNALDDWGF